MKGLKLKAKNLSFSTGNPLIVILNKKDASRLDLHPLDRISINYKNKNIIAAIDISTHGIKHNQIGLFKEVSTILNARNNSILDINIAEHPESVQYIKEKLDNKILSEYKIKKIINDIIKNKLSEVEITYFISACYTNKLTLKEISYLTKAVASSGNKLNLKNKIIIDKHSIGGIPGNRTTMIIVPILAASGLIMPKTSSRAITAPSGTADTMEVLSKVNLSINEIKNVIKKTNACLVWGGAMELATADDRLIRLEYPLSLDSKSIMLASILSKKLAVGSTHLLIDIPFGKGSKIEHKKNAIKLKQQFLKLTKLLKIKTKVILTDGTQPIGNGIGPLLECIDILKILKRSPDRPLDLEKKSIKMADIMLSLAKINKKAIDILNSSQAYKKFLQIINAQGKKNFNLKLAKFKYNVKANKSGVIKSIDNKVITKIARIAGCPNDKKAGIYLYVHNNYKVKKNSVLFTVYSENKTKLNYAKKLLFALNPIKIA